MKLIHTAALAILGVSINAMADEGMWQPHQLPTIKKQLKDSGLKIDPARFSKLTEFPMNAVISLGGCTASFVSDQGLVVSNHHCVYGSVSYNSTAKNNLIDKGFLAKTKDAELPAAPGSRIYVTESLTPVTAQISGNLNGDFSGEARYKIIEQRKKNMVAECEEDPGYRCDVYTFHGGLEYYLIKQMAIRDVRLVYAPSDKVGKFGGDTDNWMWPRHTGDWGFYRAYVGPDGKPADFSKDNVPYTPKSHLKVSAAGVDDGEFVMVAGYPGRTNRYRTASEVENSFTWSYPTAKQYREESIDIIKQVASKDSEARVKYLASLASLANYAKNYGSMIESYQKGDMLERKVALERELNKWVAAKSSRTDKYAAAISQLDSLIKQEQNHQKRDMIMGYLNRNSLMPIATRLYRLAHEKQKKDSLRDPGYQQRDMKRFTQQVKRINKRFDAKVDSAIISHFMARYITLPASERVAAFDKFFDLDGNTSTQAINETLHSMFANTTLNDEATRLKWMDASVSDFKASDDPFIKYAVAMYDTQQAQRKKDKELAGQIQQAKPAYMEALIAYQQSLGKAVYADANSSLRVTYGNVKGYSPQDGLWAAPFTTLAGKLAKYVPGDEEFDIQAVEIAAIKNNNSGRYFNKAVGSVPVNFLSTVDTTGGNSGSPTLNDKAELVGLLFDGVYESIISDWDFDPAISRSIHADSRYMLWVMEHVDGANNLIDEMEIVD